MTEHSDSLSPELADIAFFLAQSRPFDELDNTALQESAAHLVIQYYPREQVFDNSSEHRGLRILRSGAVDIRDSDNKLLDRLGEGESFHINGLNAERGEVHATVIEDTLCYLLPDKHYQALRRAHRHVDRYFSSQRNRRLRRAARYEPDSNILVQQVRSIMSHQPLCVASSDNIQTVTQQMSTRRVSSAFVVDQDKLQGIVTDRDIRERCVAQSVSPQSPVTVIMTPKPVTIDAGASLFDTTELMTRHGVHHLPVLVDGTLAGAITSSDLILARRDDPVNLVRHISRQEDVAGICELVTGISKLVVDWVQSGVRGREVSRILTAISDAVTLRLIQLAERRLGPAPVPWCWLCFGSQARDEQLLGADQDNGIVISNEYQPQHRPWFEALATQVCEGLNACGYRYCNGGVMATTEQWCQPLGLWQETVHSWTRTPTPDAVMRVSIFFDLRGIHGDTDLSQALQKTMLEQAGPNTIFQAALAANALQNKPPVGIFRRFVVESGGEHTDQLDLKKRGVLPIIDIIRLHALANGITATNSLERIDALSAARALTLIDSRNLADALNSIQQLRINHQCEQLLSGCEPGNFLNPQDLPSMAKEQLRDAFTIIDEAQSAVRQRYRAGLE